MTGLLDRETIMQLFEELDKELRWTRTRAQVYVVGGAAMSLAFARERTTADVDARIDAGHYQLTKAVRKIGREHGLGDNWLNEQATSAMPQTADSKAKTLYESPYLTITGASAEHLLGMKLLAARNKDHGDVARLIDQLGIEQPREAIRIYEALFPHEDLKAEAVDILKAVFQERDKTGNEN